MVDSQAKAHSDPTRTGRRWASWIVAACCWLYVATVLGLWLLVRTEGDRWWPATLVIFGPRWLWALPAAVLLPAAIAVRRRSLLPLGIASLLLLVPVMGFCVPWEPWLAGDTGGFRIRILTCNTESRDLNARSMRGVMDEANPDVVLFQEFAHVYEPVLFAEAGWNVRSGKGLCLGSRFPVREVEFHPDEHGWRDVGMRHELDTPAGAITVFNVHLSTAREGLEAVLAHHWKGRLDLQSNSAMRACESEELSRWVGQSAGHVVIAGDFNLPGDSLVFRDAWGRYRDAFAVAGLGLGHTKFTRWFGIRIDHILCGRGWICRRCWVGPDVGSDHHPVLADLEWIASPP